MAGMERVLSARFRAAPGRELSSPATHTCGWRVSGRLAGVLRKPPLAPGLSEALRFGDSRN